MPLPSDVRQELCLVSVLAPVLASNVALPFLSKVVASILAAHAIEPLDYSVSPPQDGFTVPVDSADFSAADGPNGGPPCSKEYQSRAKPVGQLFDFIEVGPGFCRWPKL